MEYLLTDLIDDRNRDLYNEVTLNLQVVLEKSDDDGWGSIIKDGKGIISYSPTKYPVSSFTHELLHLKCDYSGMKRPSFTARFTIGTSQEMQQEVYAEANEYMCYIYNQLIHYKIYRDYTALGFPAVEFLCDTDKDQAIAQAKKDIKALKELRKKTHVDISCKTFIFPYLLLSSPHDDSSQSKELLKELRNICDQSFYKMNKLIAAIRDDQNPDMRRYLALVFKYCEKPDVGFGYSENELIWAADV